MADIEKSDHKFTRPFTRSNSQHGHQHAKEFHCYNTSSENERERDSDPPSLGCEVPDGGTAAWLAVLGGWCVSFSCHGWVNSKGECSRFL